MCADVEATGRRWDVRRRRGYAFLDSRCFILIARHPRNADPAAIVNESKTELSTVATERPSQWREIPRTTKGERSQLLRNEVEDAQTGFVIGALDLRFASKMLIE